MNGWGVQNLVASVVARIRAELVSLDIDDVTRLGRRCGKYIGICGQGPSDRPNLARWLVNQGIESMSLNPDTVVETRLFLAEGVRKDARAR
jgi:phosphoenolpyruvate synthase/pyruvate phosphate dikinase